MRLPTLLGVNLILKVKEVPAAIVLPTAGRSAAANADEGADPNGQITHTAPSEPTYRFDNFPYLAIEILERVPTATKIFYGLDTSDGGEDDAASPEDQPGPQAPFDEHYTPKFKLVTLPWQTNEAVAREVGERDLRESLQRVDETDEEFDLKGRRGCKAGSVKDPWGGYRMALEGCTRVALEKGKGISR